MPNNAELTLSQKAARRRKARNFVGLFMLMSGVQPCGTFRLRILLRIRIGSTDQQAHLPRRVIDPGLNALFRHYRAKQPKAEVMELAPEVMKHLIVSCQKGPFLGRYGRS